MFGSGKTAFVVREMALNPTKRKTYTNVVTSLQNQIDITAEMIIKREVQGFKKKKGTDEQEPIYKYTLNTEYWKKIKEPINVVLDEAHSIISSRRSMSKINMIITDWLALIRRVIGSKEGSYGELTFISQLANRIDVIAREMATNIIYTICHFRKSCLNCGATWQENSEMPEGYNICPYCRGYELKKHSHYLELWHFPNIQSYNLWHEFGKVTFYKHYYLFDIEEYFKFYETLQWDNLFQSFYY